MSGETIHIDFSPDDYPMHVAFYPADSVADEYPLWETHIEGPGLFTMPDLSTYPDVPRVVFTDSRGGIRRVNPSAL